MQKVYKITKGLDIPLIGQALKEIAAIDPGVYGIKPTDFSGVFPKMLVKEGDKVKQGEPLFFDKYNELVKFVSPVGGTVKEIVRGARRVLLEVRIESDSSTGAVSWPRQQPSDLSRMELVQRLLESGVWPFIRQRPYGIIANPAELPRDIFISAFDSAPLAPDQDFLVQGEEKSFQTGINALKILTQGKVHLGMHADNTRSSVFLNAEGVEKHLFKGPHPAGNVGIQIHHLAPLNKGEVVWTLSPFAVIVIGRLFNEGTYDLTRLYALTGSEVNSPKYFRMIAGGSVEPMLQQNLASDNVRIISGNVLTGEKIYKTAFPGFYHEQITVIPEGNHHEFLGWALPGFNKFSMSRAFFSWLTPSKKYRLDTNYNGGERAYVITGQYEKVLPMDIFPVQLIKAIMIDDIDAMEKLGIYEVVEEDFALCEYVCTSKTDVQSIIRKGLELMRKEMN